MKHIFQFCLHRGGWSPWFDVLSLPHTTVVSSRVRVLCHIHRHRTLGEGFPPRQVAERGSEELLGSQGLSTAVLLTTYPGHICVQRNLYSPQNHVRLCRGHINSVLPCSKTVSVSSGSHTYAEFCLHTPRPEISRAHAP